MKRTLVSVSVSFVVGWAMGVVFYMLSTEACRLVGILGRSAALLGFDFNCAALFGLAVGIAAGLATPWKSMKNILVACTSIPGLAYTGLVAVVAVQNHDLLTTFGLEAIACSLLMTFCVAEATGFVLSASPSLLEMATARRQRGA